MFSTFFHEYISKLPSTYSPTTCWGAERDNFKYLDADIEKRGVVNHTSTLLEMVPTSSNAVFQYPNWEAISPTFGQGTNQSAKNTHTERADKPIAFLTMGIFVAPRSAQEMTGGSRCRPFTVDGKKLGPQTLKHRILQLPFSCANFNQQLNLNILGG